MSNHDIVLCRSFGNEPLVRIIWDVVKDGILVCRSENFDLLKSTQVDGMAVLAPSDAIYEYDEILFHQLDEAFHNSGRHEGKLERLWRQAKRYDPTKRETSTSGLPH
jgi:hypothetical protein